MPTLSADLWTAEREVRTAIVARLNGLPMSGIWHSYKRDAPNMNAYKKLFEFKDVRDGKTKLRGGYLVHRGFEPDLDDESVVCTPTRALYDVRFLMQNEDEFQRKGTALEGTNSSDELSELVARFFDSVNNDNGFGFTDLSVSMPVLIEETDSEIIDNWLANNATYRVTATLYN